MVDWNSLKETLHTTIRSFKKELSSLRTGKASIDLVEDIMVSAYGSMTPMKQVAAISIPEPRMIVISPWDRSLISEIEKALKKAPHLGINPVSESNGVRLVIPTLTEERRKQLVKEAGTQAEKFRAEIRRIRDEARSDLKSQLRAKEISEDEQRKQMEDLDALIKEENGTLEDLLRQKEQEIMNL